MRLCLMELNDFDNHDCVLQNPRDAGFLMSKFDGAIVMVGRGDSVRGLKDGQIC